LIKSNSNYLFRDIYVKTDQREDKELILTPKLLLEEFLTHQGISPDGLTIPPRAALAFQHECLSHLINLSNAKPLGDWLFPISEAPIYHGKYHGKAILISKIPSSAPNAVAFVECLICLDVNRIIATGAAGSIHPKAQAGSMVIPTHAIREEGTSYHYYEMAIDAHASKLLVKLLGESANRNHVPFLRGSTWTTDGVLRETISKMKQYSSQGVLTVEMEMSALFAMAMFRKIDLAGLLVISDTHFDGHKIVVFDKVYQDAQEDAAKILLGALCAS
jgi:purine-nucleoside phosphorylase